MARNLLSSLVVCTVLLLQATVSFAQSVTGQILDDQGLPLPGVTIQVEGTTTGTSTDMDGNFTLKVEPGERMLLISFVGFETQRKAVSVGAGKTVSIGNFSMKFEQKALEEFVVVGYGVQRKRDLTGNIAKIDAQQITQLPVTSFEAGIQGQAAGVSVTTGSGVAGASSLLRIRGISSISSSGDPLVIIYGIPITQNNFLNESGGDRGGMNNNPLAFLNPNDIESVEVLKDAAATGIYGARGANGVILITTKRAKQTDSKFWSIGYNGRVSLSNPVARPNMLNSEQYLQIRQEAWENDGNTGLAPLPGGISWEDARITDTDWIDELTRTGVKHTHSLELSKATKRTNIFLSGSYDHNESYIVGSSADRWSSRLNAEYKVNDKLKVGTNLSLTNYTVNRVDAAWSGGYGAAMSTALPIYPIRHLRDVYNEAGELVHAEGDWFRGQNNVNPVADLEQKERKTFEWRGLSNLWAQYTPLNNLIIRLEGRYEHLDVQDYIYEAPGLNQSRLDDQIGRAKKFPTWNNNYNLTATANYLWDPSEDHNFNFMVGKEWQESWTRSYSRLEYQDLDAPLYDFSGDYTRTTSNKNPTTLFRFDSYFGRVNYKIKDRYVFQTTMRTDGSSRFGVNNKYGFFPSASAAWIISEENFLRDSKVISYLKLRTSLGVTGNSGIPDYQWFGEYQVGSVGYGGERFIFPARRENPDLKWETSNNYDVGIEFGFLRDRISGDLSAYYKKTNDLLLNLTVPNNTGFTTYWDNVGSLFNQGVEFNLNTVNIDWGDFQWSTNLNAAYNYNEILSIGEYTEDAVSGGTNDTRVVVGSPVGTNFLVRFSRVDAETGRPVYLDINGNETFTWDVADRVPVGDILPDAVGGITNTFRWKNWDASFLMYYSIGGKVYDSSSKRQLGVVTDWNMRTEIFDRWQQEGDESVYPRLTLETETYGSGTPWINTDQWLHDADYIRLRRLAVGYTFNEIPVANRKIRNMRVEVSGTNLWIWTNFVGLDPEIVRDFEGQTDRNMSGNITFLTAPVERTINLAINLSL